MKKKKEIEKPPSFRAFRRRNCEKFASKYPVSISSRVINDFFLLWRTVCRPLSLFVLPVFSLLVLMPSLFYYSASLQFSPLKISNYWFGFAASSHLIASIGYDLLTYSHPFASNRSFFSRLFVFCYSAALANSIELSTLCICFFLFLCIAVCSRLSMKKPIPYEIFADIFFSALSIVCIG